MRIIDDVKGRGGKIKEFVSYCGGLPAAECSFGPVNRAFHIKTACQACQTCQACKQHLDSRCVLLWDPSTFGARSPNQNSTRIQHTEV